MNKLRSYGAAKKAIIPDVVHKQDKWENNREHRNFWGIVISAELLSKVVFGHFNQAATWSVSVTSIPSLNLIPVITFAR